MKRTLSLWFLLISSLFLFSASALELGVSPSTLTYEGFIDEEVCEAIYLMSDRTVSINVISSSTTLFYFATQEHIISGRASVPLCLTPLQKGSYLSNFTLFDSNGTTEIILPFRLNAYEHEHTFGITGFSISDSFGDVSFLGVLTVFTLGELLLLSYLVIKLVRKV